MRSSARKAVVVALLAGGTSPLLPTEAGAATADVCLVFQLKNGRVTEAWEHIQDLYAWDEFWS